MALTQQELEGRLWAAANSLRGPVDPGDFKSYIFPLLFYKRISDAWDDEHARAVADFGKDLTPDVEADYHRFQLPDGCHWRDLRKVHENVGVGLQNILDRIQQANPDSLGGIFGDVQWGHRDKLPEHALLNLIEAFHTLDLSPSRVGHDVLGNAYEYLLKQFADESGKKAGEFFTPRSVVRLLTRILDPQPTDTVYDPACGSGGMLVEAANEVLESGGSLRQMRFYGQEVNLTTSAIARMNLFLHDIEDVVIRRGDTLRDPKFLDERGRLQRFDIVITNPPFSLKNWGADVWAHDPWGRAACGQPPVGNGDWAWVQHMLTSMKPDTGRVGVVMPHGVLFRGGPERDIRGCLLRSDHIEAVIALPPNLFYTTVIPACLVIARASKPPTRQGHVLFVDGSTQFSKGRNQNQLDDQHVERILAAYRADNSSDDPALVMTRLVPVEEVEANGWDLNLARYLSESAGATLDIGTAVSGLRESHAALYQAKQHMEVRLEIGTANDADTVAVAITGGLWSRDLSRIGDVVTRVRRPVEVVPTETYRQIGIRSHGRGIFHKPGVLGRELGNKAVFQVEPGDLVFNIVFAWEGAVAVARETERGWCASHRFPTYRVNEGVDAEYLMHVLLSRRGLHLLGLASPGTAGRNRTLNQKMLMEMAIPVPDLRTQRLLVEDLRAADTMANLHRGGLEAVEALRMALLEDLMFGRADTPEPADGSSDI